MAPLLLVIALVLQSASIYADTDIESISDEVALNEPEPDVIVKPTFDNEAVKDFKAPSNDWVDLFLLTSNPMFPTSSAAMMSQVANNNTNQTCEEQLENIKKIAEDISRAIQSEMANVLNFAMLLNGTEKNNENDDSLRKKRSVETPMDSTQLIMRLLKHIKSNNEYQNIAIEKMMSAQEIADKFGIEFNADPEILSDLAVAANDHAQELTSMLKDACDMKNATQEVEFVPINEQSKGNETYYAYALHPEESIQASTVPPFEYIPDVLPKPQQSVNHVGHIPEHHCHSFESQIPSPQVHHHSSPRPNFYDPSIYTSDFYNPYADQFSTILIPVEEPEPEPEVVGEEIEETITSKLSVERGDEPGSSTVNQVTSYTVAEKSHFRTPQIEKYPQQFQYCFFLV